MNREDPNRPEYRGDRTDYFDFVAKTAVKRTSDTLVIRFKNLCRGRDRQDEPAKYVELMEMVENMKVSRFNHLHKPSMPTRYTNRQTITTNVLSTPNSNKSIYMLMLGLYAVQSNLQHMPKMCRF